MATMGIKGLTLFHMFSRAVTEMTFRGW